MRRWLWLALVLLMPSVTEATTYHVSNSTANGYVVGNNSNNCTASSTPCLTIAGGLGKMASGDTLTVNDGTYSESLADTIPSGGGTDATRTVMQCYSRRGCTITSSSAWAIRFLDSNTNWITVKNFILISTATTVVAFHSSTSFPNQTWPHHIRLEDNEIKNSSIYCLYTGWGQFNEFLNNTIHACGEQGVYALSRDSTYRGNEIYGNGLVSTPNKQQAMQLQTSGGLKPTGNLIEENYFHDNVTECLFLVVTSGNTVRRNVFDTCGIGLSARNGVGDVDNTDIDQNVFYGNGTGLQITDTGSTGNRCRNNIAVGNTANFSITGGLCTLTTNLTTGTATNIWTDPVNGNFTLKSGSAAIDAGTDISLLYNGSAPDQGAFETFTFSSCAVEASTPTVVNIIFVNNVQPPLLPATGVTGFSTREDAAAKTNSSVARVGDNQINLTVNAAFSAGTTIDISYSGGNLTDSSLIGNASNQTYLATLTNQSCTNNVSGAPSSVLTQKYFRWHGIYGTEAAPVVKSIGGAINGNGYSVPGGKLRLRLKVACTAADCAPLGMVLRYSLNSGSYTAVPDAFTADNIRFYGTGVNADVPTSGTSTTELLTSDHATNVAGSLIRTANAVPTIDLSQNSETEMEYAIELYTDVSVGDTYDFRLYDQNGAALSAYTVTPRLTVTAMQAGGGM